MEIGSTVPLVHRHLAAALVMVQLEHNPLKKPAGTQAGVRVWQGFQKRYPDPYPANPDPLPVRVLPTRGLPEVVSIVMCENISGRHSFCLKLRTDVFNIRVYVYLVYLSPRAQGAYARV
jgi:hypothetical protein